MTGMLKIRQTQYLNITTYFYLITDNFKLKKTQEMNKKNLKYPYSLAKICESSSINKLGILVPKFIPHTISKKA